MKRFGRLATLTITLLTLAACGNSVEGLEAAEQRWVEAGIDSYLLEYTIEGGEGALLSALTPSRTRSTTSTSSE